LKSSTNRSWLGVAFEMSFLDGPRQAEKPLAVIKFGAGTRNGRHLSPGQRPAANASFSWRKNAKNFRMKSKNVALLRHN
jgi:hypothetical protein